MGKATKYDKLYVDTLLWCARRMEPRALELYGDELLDWAHIVQVITDFWKTISSLSSKKEVDKAYETQINQLKSNKATYNCLYALFVFHHRLKKYPLKEEHKYFKDIDDDYKNQYTYTKNDYTYVPMYKFIYRDTNWPVYWDEGSSSYYVVFVDKKGETHVFDLVWDWDFPIDLYLDVESEDFI